MEIKFRDIVAIILVIILILVSFKFSYVEPSYCTYTNNTNLCYTQLAELSKNVSFCNYINTSLDTLKCQYFYAINSTNFKNCLYIKNLKYKNYCVLYYSFKSYHLCKYYNNTDSCLTQVAIHNRDLSLCNKTENKELCIYSYAFYIGNSSLCNRLHGKYLNSCKLSFLKVNIVKKNVTSRN